MYGWTTAVAKMHEVNTSKSRWDPWISERTNELYYYHYRYGLSTRLHAILNSSPLDFSLLLRVDYHRKDGSRRARRFSHSHVFLFRNSTQCTMITCNQLSHRLIPLGYCTVTHTRGNKRTMRGRNEIVSYELPEVSSGWTLRVLTGDRPEWLYVQ